MNIFIYLYVVLIMVSIVAWKREKTLGTFFFFILSFIILCIPALRDKTVGTDTIHYVAFFLHPNSGYDHRETDLGFQIWNATLRAIGCDEQLYIIINAIISLSGIFFFINKESPYRVYSLLLFVIVGQFYSLEMAAMRQTLAISMFLFALHYYMKGKSYWKYAIGFYFISIMFHGSVIWCMPAILVLDKVKINKWMAAALLLASFGIGLSGVFDYHKVLGSVFSLTQSTGVTDRYEVYSQEVFGANSEHRVLWDMLPLTLICAACIYFADNINTPLLKYFILGMIANNLLISDPISFRIVIYMVMLVIVVLPIVFQYKKKGIAIAIYSMTVIYFCYKSYASLSGQMRPDFVGNKFVPYKFFFE